MTFPGDPLDIVIEILVDGVWLDITKDALARDALNISRGQADEARRADPGRCAFSLTNPTGRYSLRHPMSDLYGKIGRNTQTRVSVRTGDTYLDMPGVAGAIVSAPDATALGITADIDVRVDVTLPSWPSACGLASKYRIASNQRSWSLLNQQGQLQLYWSPDGTLASRISALSTERVSPPPSGRLAVRATLDVNNGAGGWTARFYTSDSISGTWTQLGDPVTTAGTTSIFDSTAPLEINSLEITVPPLVGRVHALELRSGIGGTVVANPVFTGQTAGAVSFADTATSPNTWTLAGGTEITNRQVRFVGEISEWPSRWNLSDKDVWVPIQASGILRRLGQGQAQLASAMFRGLITSPSLVAYWPAEDPEGSTSIASAVSGARPMKIARLPTFAADEAFVCSKPLPTLQTSQWTGAVPTYTVTGQTQIRWLMHVNPTASGDQSIINIFGTGTCAQWRLAYETGGALSLKGYDANFNQLFSSGNVTFAVDGKLMRISIELTQNGSDVDWSIVTLEDAGGFVNSRTLTGRTVGQITQVLVNSGGGLAASTNTVTIGHISVQNAISSIYDLRSQFQGYVGEKAGTRIARLCAEEGIPLELYGYPDDTVPMGAQKIATLLDLLSDAATADGGILGEARGQLGLSYVTRVGLYNDAPALELDYQARHLAPPLEPTEDDQNIRNDWTVSRVGGSSARYEQTDGPLSVAAPPAGVGRYDDNVTLGVATDEQLPDLASWRVHLGTWDEARYPTMTVNLAANPQLIEAVAAVEFGRRATIDNLPPWLPPGLVRLLVRGYTETMSALVWRWAANCTPAGPYDVAVYNESRYGTAGSELALSIDADDVTLSVATTLGPIWTTTDVPFDILVGGERMTVTAVSGASSPQTFTVTRSVNDVIKPHTSGTDVDLFTSAVYAL